MENQEAETVGGIVCREWIARFGTPRQLHTDCGSNFESRLIKKICVTLGIDKTHTVPYNPKSDGLVERLNRTIGEMLSSYVREDQLDWDVHVPFVMMAYRASVQESTGFSPNKLLFGRENSSPLTVMVEPEENVHFLSITQYLQQLDEVLKLAYAFVRGNLQKAHERQKTYYDQRVHGAPYKVGDLVWRSVKRMKKGRTWSLAPRFEGPYHVIEVLSEVNYRVRKEGERKTAVEHFDHLKPYTEAIDREGTVTNVTPDGDTDSEVTAVTGGSQRNRKKRTRVLPARYADYQLY